MNIFHQLKETLEEELYLAQELMQAADSQRQALKTGGLKNLDPVNEAIIRASQKINILTLKRQEISNQENYRLIPEEEEELKKLKARLVGYLKSLKKIMEENVTLSQNGLRFHHLFLSLSCLSGKQKIYGSEGEVKKLSQTSQLINKTC